MRFGRRTAAILRAFNLRCGIGTEVEYPSARYGSQPVDGPAKEHDVSEQWERMLDVWYETVGYDRKTGKPKRRRSCARSASTGSPRTSTRSRREERGGESPGEAQPKASRAHIEVTTWVTKHVGGDGTGSKLFDEPIAPRRHAAQRPAPLLRAASPSSTPPSGAPTTPSSARTSRSLVNDAVLGVTYDLDTPLTGGERITLLGQFMGG